MKSLISTANQIEYLQNIILSQQNKLSVQKIQMSKQNKIISLQKNKLKEKNIIIVLKEEKIQALTYKIYGTKSEKWTEQDHKQARLFDEAENNTEAIPNQEDKKTIEIKSHRRKKGGRKPLDPNLPHVDIIHDLPEDERIGPNGREMVYTGKDDLSKEVKYIPAQIKVINHIYKIYAELAANKSLPKNKLKTYQKRNPSIRTARRHKKLIPKSFLTPSLMAYILVSKFQDGLPYYRLKKYYEIVYVDFSQ